MAGLQVEGFAMRGRFTPGIGVDEWCERRLLARVHTYTVKRLRAEIEPVAARDFLRFLLGWQRAMPDARMQGPDAIEVVVAQLEGFEAAAGAWETEILPARVEEYEPAWLDDQCLSGRISWARLRPRRPAERRAWHHAGTDDADHIAGTPACSALGLALADARRHSAKRSRAGGRRLHPRAWRLVLRRAGRRHGPAAQPGRGGAGRTGGARSS
jgi:hypothetical protein